MNKPAICKKIFSQKYLYESLVSAKVKKDDDIHETQGQHNIKHQTKNSNYDD